MLTFVATYRKIRTLKTPMSLHFPDVVPANASPEAETLHLLQRRLVLTEEQVESIRECLTDSDFAPIFTAEDSPVRIIALYLRRGLDAEMAGYELANVVQVPEQMREEPRGRLADLAPEWCEKSYDCPFHNPGNPQLSDPWARGY